MMMVLRRRRRRRKLKKVGGSVRRVMVGEIVTIFALQEADNQKGRQLRSAKSWCRFADYNNLFSS
jgi:hypothetical protein